MSNFISNSLGVFLTPDHKVRKPGDILEHALDPTKMGGLFEKKTPKTPDVKPLDLPQAPDQNAASNAAAQKASRRRASQSETVYTSPLGVSGQAQTSNKMLLGQ